MVTLPPDFVKTKIPGYYWSVSEHWLYSIKSGKLKFLVRRKFPWITKQGPFFGWTVSDNNKIRYLSVSYLETLNNDQPKKQEVQVIRKVEQVLTPKHKSKHYKNKKYSNDLFGDSI